jgi:two-component system sensor histidine kinase KdpD
MIPSKEPGRPEPEDLLAMRDGDGRGRLKVYLGMAPGVGKTYAMLEAAHRHRRQGVDVVIGIVETHGRRETESLLEGLEILPRRRAEYRGHQLGEFDLDAALARRPSLLLVDELAHSNVPDARHPKRWQDVDELLAAGIDVHTTLNIQHIETLNDIVARITGVRVRETLPDRVLERADEIELVDLTPRDLIARLEQGKVYMADLVGRARENFFTPGNLAALRELALRHTADRVDADMVGYMKQRAIPGPWPAGDRLLVCVSGDGVGEAVVRAGRRLADQAKVRWTVLHAETAGRSAAREEEAELQKAMALAERLQARTDRVSGADPVTAVLDYARRGNFTQIVVGCPRRSGWRRRRSFAAALVARPHGLAVHFVPRAVDSRSAGASPRRLLSLAPREPRAILISIAGVGLVTLIGTLLPVVGGLANASMLYLAAVLISAVLDGVGAGVLAALLAALSSNFFFTEPRWTLFVADGRDLVALAIFLVVGITTGAMAGRIRDQVRSAEARMVALRTLYDFSRRLGEAKTADALLHAVVLQAWRLSSRDAMLLLPQDEKLSIRYAWPPRDRLEAGPWAAANWAWQKGEAAGVGTATLPSSPWHFRPVRSGDRVVGVFGILVPSPFSLPREFVETLDAMLDQSAVALDRIVYAKEASRADALAQTERFREALLSSISHDLRTPLTSILGSVTALRSDRGKYDEAARADLLETIEEEAERLDRFVRNLLDLTRLESGSLEARRDWLSVAEVIHAACRRFEDRLGDRRLVRRIPAGLPLLRGDFLLLETVLVNLLDNFAKHAKSATFVEVSAEADASQCRIRVTDDGEGVAAEHRPHLFERFFRVPGPGYTPEGSGLGLSICRGLVEAMGGRIEVESPVGGGRGVCFTIRFPVETQPEAIGDAPPSDGKEPST